MKTIDQDFMKRIRSMMIGIVGMGIFLAFLIEVNYGTDTSSFMNLALSNKTQLSFGTCMILVNALLIVPVIFLERKLIHLGTVANMVLIGYISDFCRYLFHHFLPDALFTAQPSRTIVFILALIPFLIAVALYMNADIGQAPYDAVPTLLSHRLPIPFTVIRMTWDFSAIAIGMLLGKALQPTTVIMALTIGPSVTYIGKWLKKRGL